MATAIRAREGTVRGAARAVAGGLYGGLGAPEAGRRVGFNWAEGVAAGIRAGGGLVRSAANAVIPSGGVGAFDDGYGIGRSFTEGIAAGIRAGDGGGSSAARALVRQIEAAARAEANAKSPSELFARLGEDLSAGLSVGIATGGATASSAMEGLILDLSADVAASSGQSLFVELGRDLGTGLETGLVGALRGMVGTVGDTIRDAADLAIPAIEREFTGAAGSLRLPAIHLAAERGEQEARGNVTVDVGGVTIEVSAAVAASERPAVAAMAREIGAGVSASILDNLSEQDVRQAIRTVGAG
jgi:hypothetical protein